MPKLDRATRKSAQSDLLAGMAPADVCAKYGITIDAVRKWRVAPPAPAMADAGADPAAAALAAAGAGPGDEPIHSAEAEEDDGKPNVPSIQLTQSDIERLLIQVPRLMMRAACFGSAIAFKLPVETKEAAAVISKLAELKKEEEEILGILSPFVVQYAGALTQYAGPVALAGYLGTIAVGSIARLLTVRAYAREYWAAVRDAQAGTTGSIPRPAGNGKDNAHAAPPSQPG